MIAKKSEEGKGKEKKKPEKKQAPSPKQAGVYSGKAMARMEDFKK